MDAQSRLKHVRRTNGCGVKRSTSPGLRWYEVTARLIDETPRIGRMRANHEVDCGVDRGSRRHVRGTQKFASGRGFKKSKQERDELLGCQKRLC